MTKDEEIKSLKQNIKNLNSWVEKQIYPKFCNILTFESKVNSVRGGILQATEGLRANERKLRLQNHSVEADLIKESYNELLLTVDVNELRKMGIDGHSPFEIDGEGGPKEKAKDLISTLEDVLESLGKPKAALITDAPSTLRTVKKWKIPRGYIGSQAIINSTVGELKEELHLSTQGDEKHKIPRATLEYWQNRDSGSGGELEGNIKRGPSNYEVYYPKKWLKKQIKKYKPRVRKP